MFEIIIFSVVLFLSVTGLCELMHRLWILLIRPCKPKNMLLLCLYEDTALEQINTCLEEMRWHGEKYAGVLVGIDMGLEADRAAACRMLASEEQSFIFTDLDSLPDIIRQRS